ncbi:MAG: hypothetical protein KAJ14_16130 [Candidatus Omnitrophica bacterium]|nr:hypothetical protein [Candidatus Omnitrophota bacterium]
MKRVIIITLAITFTILNINFATAQGITGGTIKNTTEKQAYETSGDHKQCIKSPISPEAAELTKEIITKVFPVVGTTEKLLKGMKWTAEQQRKGGGITGIGSTVRDIEDKDTKE